MRVFVFPVATLVVIAGAFHDEPSETEMQRAFESSLQMQVRNTLGFIAETAGDDAVEKLQAVGSDKFAVRGFRKHACSRGQDAGHLCSFTVEIELMNGNLQRRIDGRFAPAASGQLSFAERA